MNIKCENCNKNYELDAQEQKSSGGSRIIFHVCPHCQTRYDAYEITRKGRAIQQQISGIRGMLQVKQTNWLISKLEKLQANLANEITDLTKSPNQE